MKFSFLDIGEQSKAEGNLRWFMREILGYFYSDK
jgi:hypothetical protein